MDANSVTVTVEAAVYGRPEYSAAASVTPGGAAVGTVAATGDNAAHLAGKRVLVGPEQPCGECDVCRRGGAAVCPHGQVLGRTVPGTLAETVVARARWVVPIDGALDLPGPTACLAAREAAWAYAMYTRAGTAPGEPVAVIGDDAVARFIVQIAAARGNRPMVLSPTIAGATADAIAVDVADGAGATALCDAVAAAATAAGHGERPWKVFDTNTGAHRGVALARPRTTVTVLSLPGVDLAAGDADPGALLRADGAVLGIAGAHPDLIPEVAALAVRGDIDLAAAARIVAFADVPPADSSGAAIVSVVKISA